MTVENNKIIKSIFISFFLILSPKNAEGALVLFQTNFLKFAFYIRQYIILLSMFKSNILTSLFALFVFYTLQNDEWCVHNRLFNANFEEIFL
jgi:hypothetical protein